MDTVADVCIIIEGSYPYVTGGVSSWVHDLLHAQSDLSFHLLVLKADDAPMQAKFTVPANVVGITEVALQRDEPQVPVGHATEPLMRRLEAPLKRLLRRGGRAELQEVIAALRSYRGITRGSLLNSEPAFDMLQRTYYEAVPGCSFLRYFWSWRSLVGGLFAVLLADLPRARVYHAISTGYAGLFMARAALETGRPGLLTEHGIYTNERRIEIAMADWLIEAEADSLDIERRHRDLRDFWLDAFQAYSNVCYACCERIVTLYRGNQLLQLRDGAPVERMAVVPNGIDVNLYSSVRRVPGPRPPTVALIGRVVPIKDVKAFIRAVAMLRDRVPGVRALMLGPIDEDPIYFNECREMVTHLGLEGMFEFTGRVKLAEWLGEIDVVVLTSLSEAQPLVLLEAGAAGVPCVATDVGACREIIEGRGDESPPLGPGGIVTPMSNPRAVAHALADLLLDPALHQRCSQAMRDRTKRYYDKTAVDSNYRDLYAQCLATVSAAPAVAREV